jgi:hypothetical protein
VKRLLGLFLLAIFLIPAPARAQIKPVLSTLEIDLWPEYDRASVLVIYHAVLSSEVSLPAEIAFRIPIAAVKPNAVAVGPAQDSVGDVKTTTQINGEWLSIAFVATNPVIQFEYYDPGLQKNGVQRNFVYHWPGDYAVQSLTVVVQQPLGATNLHISPNMGSGAQRQDGLTYYSYQAGSLTAGQDFTISIDYQKISDTLSSANIPVEPSAPISDQTPGRNNLREALPWLIGALGFVMIAAGGLWYWQSGRQKAPALNRQRHRPAATKDEDQAVRENVYCHQCGKRASPGDRFCRSCGTRLRVE